MGWSLRNQLMSQSGEHSTRQDSFTSALFCNAPDVSGRRPIMAGAAVLDRHSLVSSHVCYLSCMLLDCVRLANIRLPLDWIALDWIALDWAGLVGIRLV